MARAAVLTIVVVVGGAPSVACGGNLAPGSQASGGDAGALDASGGSSGGGSSGVDSGSVLTHDAGTLACPAGETLCAGTCVNEQTDNADCGGCGLVCRTACTAGRCLVPIAATTDAIDIVVDSTSVYWTSPNGGFLAKAPLAGGAITTLVDDPSWPDVPFGLALDAANVYFTDKGTVESVSLQGGPITALLLTNPALPSGIAVDLTDIVVSGASGLWVAGLDGGAPSSPSGARRGGTGPRAVALAGSSIYWVSTDGLLRTPLGGGTTVTLGPLPLNPPLPMVGGAVAVDATNVYWSMGAWGTPEPVVQLSRAGGTAVTLAYAELDPYAGLAVDDASVYYPKYGSGPRDGGSRGAIVKVPIGGGAPVTLVATNAPVGIAVDATSVYFTSEEGIFRITPK